jgi:hypothetical protein
VLRMTGQLFSWVISTMALASASHRNSCECKFWSVSLKSSTVSGKFTAGGALVNEGVAPIGPMYSPATAISAVTTTNIRAFFIVANLPVVSLLKSPPVVFMVHQRLGIFQTDLTL